MNNLKNPLVIDELSRYTTAQDDQVVTTLIKPGEYVSKEVAEGLLIALEKLVKEHVRTAPTDAELCAALLGAKEQIKKSTQ